MATTELMDFYADWCAPCQHMNPIIDEIEKEFGDKITLTKIDIDKQPDIAQQYNVLSIPTYIIRKDGKVTDQLVGAQPKEALTSRLK